MTRMEFIKTMLQSMADEVVEYNIVSGGSEAQILLKDGTVLNIKVTDLTGYEFNFVNLKKDIKKH